MAGWNFSLNLTVLDLPIVWDAPDRGGRQGTYREGVKIFKSGRGIGPAREVDLGDCPGVKSVKGRRGDGLASLL